MPERGVCGVGLSLGYSADRLLDLGPALDRLEPLGLDAVEIFLPSLGVVVGGRVRPRALATLRAACAHRPFAITLHGPLASSLGDVAHNRLQSDVCRAGLEVAHALGARVLVKHAPVLGPDQADSVDDVEVEALLDLASDAEAASCVIAVETMWAREGEWTATPAQLARTLGAVGHPWIGACIDFSHAALNVARHGGDYLAELAALAPWARHLHLHDSFARPAAFRPWSRGDAVAFGFGDLHLPPGAGALPWEALAALPYGGPALANLEVDARWEDEWPDTVAWTRDWVARCRAAPRFAAADQGL